jgi:hypothetical protein
MVKKPGLISAREKTFYYKNISSIELYTPILGFTKIKINSLGLDSMLVEGFERAEAEEIRRLVDINRR